MNINVRSHAQVPVSVRKTEIRMKGKKENTCAFFNGTFQWNIDTVHQT